MRYEPNKFRKSHRESQRSLLTYIPIVLDSRLSTPKRLLTNQKSVHKDDLSFRILHDIDSSSASHTTSVPAS